MQCNKLLQNITKRRCLIHAMQQIITKCNEKKMPNPQNVTKRRCLIYAMQQVIIKCNEKKMPNLCNVTNYYKM